MTVSGLYLTEEEWALARQSAKMAGMKTNGWIRRAVVQAAEYQFALELEKQNEPRYDTFA